MMPFPTRMLLKRAVRQAARPAGFLRAAPRANLHSLRVLSALPISARGNAIRSSNNQALARLGFVPDVAAFSSTASEPLIAYGDKVSLHMTGRLTNGTSFGSTEDDVPIVFVVGSGDVIPGLEEGVIGLSKGEKKHLMIPPQKAFGKDKQIVSVPRKQLNLRPEDDAKLEVGKALQLKSGDQAWIVKLDEENVELDLAHPYAGETLLIDLTIVDRVPHDQLSKFEQLVMPETITPGDNKTYPARGDTLSMHYTGKLAADGKVFDSSVTRGKPFEFQIGVGQVIRGWDEGVMRMSKGEKALLHINSAKAYGPDGAGDAIPPDADLIFEVELLDIKRPASSA